MVSFMQQDPWVLENNFNWCVLMSLGNIFALPILLGREGYDKVSVNRSEFRDVLTMSTQVTDQLTLDMIELVYESHQQVGLLKMYYIPPEFNSHY